MNFRTLTSLPGFSSGAVLQSSKQPANSASGCVLSSLARTMQEQNRPGHALFGIEILRTKGQYDVGRMGIAMEIVLGQRQELGDSVDDHSWRCGTVCWRNSAERDHRRHQQLESYRSRAATQGRAHRFVAPNADLAADCRVARSGVYR